MAAKFSDYIKEQKEKAITSFFGEVKHTSNKYFQFKRVIDENTCIIITNNITDVKNNPVYIAGSNKAVYLKEWQIWPVHSYDEGMNAYAVKLNRNFFKKYTFKKDFEGYELIKEEEFDDILKVAKEQDEVNMKIACGHMK